MRVVRLREGFWTHEYEVEGTLFNVPARCAHAVVNAIRQEIERLPEYEEAVALSFAMDEPSARDLDTRLAWAKRRATLISAVRLAVPDIVRRNLAPHRKR